MLVHTPAIVISTLRYGDSHLIVKTYTLSSGIKTYLLKGILKSRKGKFKTSLFQPLTQLEIVANHRNKGSMEYLKEAKILNTYQNLHTDVVKSGIVFFLAEMLKNSIKEEEKNESLYHYLENTFEWLDHHDSVSNFHLLFLIKLSRYLGFYPDISQIEKPFFNLLEGTFETISINNYCIAGKNLNILKQLLGINFEELPNIKLNQIYRSQFLDMLLLYYTLHIEGFHKPKSLSVLNEIFS